MAGGRIGHHPGYWGRPDAETRALIPTLARMCRAGYVTIGSQPGMTDGTYQQRAAVDLLCDFVRLRRLRTMVSGNLHLRITYTKQASMWTYLDNSSGMVVTRRGDTYLTTFGNQLRRSDVEKTFRGAHKGARKAAADAWHVAVIDTRWGPHNHLWKVMRTSL